jgi:threonyl-tRNA synthetase
VLHRALIGSFERFLAILLEHFNGQFPPWLAPEQVRLLPVEASDQEYAESVATSLPTTLVSVTDATKTLSQRIRAAHDDRVPYMIIVGSDERCSGTISVRDRQERTCEDVDPTEFADYLATEIDERQVRPTVVEHL